MFFFFSLNNNSNIDYIYYQNDNDLKNTLLYIIIKN